MSLTTAAAARSMPRLRSIGFIPAATSFRPELFSFQGGRHDDQCDSVSQALSEGNVKFPMRISPEVLEWATLATAIDGSGHGHRPCPANTAVESRRRWSKLDKWLRRGAGIVYALGVGLIHGRSSTHGTISPLANNDLGPQRRAAPPIEPPAQMRRAASSDGHQFESPPLHVDVRLPIPSEAFAKSLQRLAPPRRKGTKMSLPPDLPERVDRDELIAWLDSDADEIARFVELGVLRPDADGTFALPASITSVITYLRGLEFERIVERPVGSPEFGP
jgi:hypothetical protein